MFQLDCSKLRPHQITPAERLLSLLSRGINCVDLSDTGTGKTYVAAVVAKALQLSTLVVVPKIGIHAWEKAMEHFGERFSIVNYEMLRTGKTPFGCWENPPPVVRPKRYLCEFCQCEVDLENIVPCYANKRGVHCIRIKTKAHRYGKFTWASQVQFVIFDEAHRCSALDSLEAETLYAARRDRKLVLGITATAACSPLQLRSLGFILGLHGGSEKNIEAMNYLDWGVMPSYWGWLHRHGCGKLPALPGLHWKVGKDRQKEIMAEIHADIIPSRGVRVRTASIPNFPERQITSELFDVSNPEKIDALYAEMKKPLSDLEKRALLDVSPDLPITQQLRARQKVELFKVPVLVELAQDYVAKGLSVALFVNFTQTIDELMQRLNTIWKIDGRQSFKERVEAIAAFQTDTARIIVVQNAAGGLSVSLNDIRGEFPRIGLVCPGFSAQQLIQIFGRLHRDGGQSTCFYKLIFAARTLEVGMQRAIAGKLGNLEALNDSDLAPGHSTETTTL